MPYKSQAQRRLFHWLQSQGKLAPGVVHEYDVASKGKKLPEYVKRKKAFGGQVEAKSGTHCPACDYPLDQVPVAMDAGEGCPRCGYGSAKEVPHKAHGGEMMEPSAYRAHGGEMCPKCGHEHKMARGGSVSYCARCGSAMSEGGYVPLKAQGGMIGNMKEMYPRHKTAGEDLDDGVAHRSFAKALKHRRQK